jgi:DedD protein
VNDILKQRLVGALILVALGIVFWPIIFVQPEDKTASHQQSIKTPRSSITPIEVSSDGDLRALPDLAAFGDSPDRGELTETDALAEATPSTVRSGAASQSGSNTAAAPANAPEQLVMDSDGIPLAWTLQVVTVSSADKAEALRKQLLDMSQKAYIVIVRSNGKKLYRVCIGPKFERVELETLQASINAQFKVNSIVARYIP